ncbi:MAG: signal peptidase II [Clostridia bacterium]|nr:signal peptidase II [Clostridia bacterium]
MPNRTLFFIVVGLAAVAGIVYYYQCIPADNFRVRLALGFLMGGASSNLIDRVRVGHVTDFLDFRVWPVFNMADTAIVVGTGLLVFHLLKEEIKHYKA